MIDIEKLFICEGRPSQELIDYQVDACVKKMIDKYIIDDSPNLNKELFYEGLFDKEKTFCTADEICIYTQAKYFDDIIDDVKKSILRYSPFINFHRNAGDPRKQKTNKKPEKIIGVQIYLMLEITPEMKKAFLLAKELPEKELDPRKKLKI